MINVGRKHLYGEIAMYIVHAVPYDNTIDLGNVWCVEQESVHIIHQCKEISSLLKTLSPLCILTINDIISR